MGNEEEQRQVMVEVTDDDAPKGDDFPEDPKRSCAERLTRLWIERRDELKETLSEDFHLIELEIGVGFQAVCATVIVAVGS